MFQGSEQESAELAFVAAEPFEIIFFEEPCEKRLRQVFSVLARGGLPANINIEGIPVRAAQRLERHVGLWCAAAASSEHDRPVGRGENVGRGAGYLA